MNQIMNFKDITIDFLRGIWQLPNTDVFLYVDEHVTRLYTTGQIESDLKKRIINSLHAPNNKGDFSMGRTKLCFDSETQYFLSEEVYIHSVVDDDLWIYCENCEIGYFKKIRNID